MATKIKPVYQRLNSSQWQIVFFRKWTLWWDAGRSFWHFESYLKYGGNSIAQFTPIGTLHLSFSDLTLKEGAHGN